MTSNRLLFFALIYFGLSQNITAQNYPTAIQEEYYQDKSNLIKVNLWGLVNSAIVLSYERAVTQETSVELGIKWLGAPLSQAYVNKGIAAEVGYKIKAMYFLRSVDFYTYRHLLHGAFLRPKLGFHYFSDDSSSINKSVYRILNAGIEAGKQWTFNNIFSIEMHVGFYFYGGPERYLRADGTTRSSSDTWTAGDLYGNENTAINGGLSFGILFGKYENELKNK